MAKHKRWSPYCKKRIKRLGHDRPGQRQSRRAKLARINLDSREYDRLRRRLRKQGLTKPLEIANAVRRYYLEKTLLKDARYMLRWRSHGLSYETIGHLLAGLHKRKRPYHKANIYRRWRRFVEHYDELARTHPFPDGLPRPG